MLRSIMSRVTRSASRPVSAAAPRAAADLGAGKAQSLSSSRGRKRAVQDESIASASASGINGNGNGNGTAMPPPATPPAKKPRRKTPNAALPASDAPAITTSEHPIPSTPTPAPIHLMTGLNRTEDIDDAMSSHTRMAQRGADPYATNAPLLTPNGTGKTAYQAPATPLPGTPLPPGTLPAGTLSQETLPAGIAVSSSTTLPSTPSQRRRAAAPTPRTTSANLLQTACDHLTSVNAGLRPVVEQHHCHIFSPQGLGQPIDPFRSLASGIMAQQVSGAAASAIKRKFMLLFAESHNAANGAAAEAASSTLNASSNATAQAPLDELTFPTPAQVASAELSRLRQAGLSQRKAEYIQGLAQKFASGELTVDWLLDARDEEIMQTLTAVRGLGRWSVEMFMCFALKRMDVFSTGDLGVQRGIAAFLGRDVKKLKTKGGKWKYVSEQEMLDAAAPFVPYRSLFMWYMWRIEDVDVSAVQG